MDYQTGHIKRDPATGAVAIRTEFPEVGHLAVHAWLVATVGSGAVTKITADIDHWGDLYTPDSGIAAVRTPVHVTSTRVAEIESGVGETT